MRSWLGRRWRSISFRAGLWAALLALLIGIVGAVAYSAALVGSGVGFSAGGFFQTAVLDQIETQITSGVAPEDLSVRMYHLSERELETEPEWTFWAVLDGDAVIGSDGVVSRSVLEGPFVGFSDSPGAAGFWGTVQQQVDTRWYIIERTIATPDGRSLRAVAAIEDLTSLREQLRIDRRFSGPIVLLLTLTSALATAFFTRRTLRRVERMRSAVDMITQDSLDQRVPLTNAADSIDKLGATMNAMLERLERATKQQNQFLADASHELRSPVAGLLAQLEVAAAYPERVESHVLIPKLAAEAQRLQGLVNDLLFVSRADASEIAGVAGGGGSSPHVVVSELLEAEAAHQKLIGAAVTFAPAQDSNGVVAVDRRDLERAVRNLVDNAVRHAGTTVQLGSRVDGSKVVIDVVDDGPGVPAEQSDRIFDRFVRLDESRTRDDGGAGLGLAIVRQIARKHGGDVRLVQSRAGAHFELTLPAIAPADALSRS